jgi:hypothetical protein
LFTLAQFPSTGVKCDDRKNEAIAAVGKDYLKEKLKHRKTICHYYFFDGFLLLKLSIAQISRRLYRQVMADFNLTLHPTEVTCMSVLIVYALSTMGKLS